MPQGYSYEPKIRDGGSDTETIERLQSKKDPYPYIKHGDDRIYDYSDEVVCIEMLNMDKKITDMLFASVEYFKHIYYLRMLKSSIQDIGLTSEVARQAHLILHKRVTSATEAKDEATAAIRNVFHKLNEYIRETSSSLSTWIQSMSDLQERSIATMADLNEEYIRIYRTKTHEMHSLTLDMEHGGTPTADALLTLTARSKEVLSILSQENNAANTPLVKLIQKAKRLYVSGDTKELDDFLSKNEEDNVDKDIVDEFQKIQDKFTGIGITFSEDMAAAFEDVLEYRDSTMRDLGYTEDTFKKIIATIARGKDIASVKYISVILNRLSTYFSSIDIEESNADDTRYDMYINTIPKILTIVVSIYRTTILAVREYTSIALSLEKGIVEHLR